MERLNRFFRLCKYRLAQPAVCVNHVDPVTQENVADIPVPFKVCLNASRQYVLLDAPSTAEYILASGKAVNLVTQAEFNAVELARLDALTKADVRKNLESARERAQADFELQQLCQAMEVEPARLWSVLLDASFSVSPSRTMALLGPVVEIYAGLIDEYRSLDSEKARAFHSDNLQQLQNLDISTGDAIIYTTLLALVSDLDFSEEEDSLSSSSEDTEEYESDDEASPKRLRVE